MAAVDQVVQHATRQGWPTSKLDVWHAKCRAMDPAALGYAKRKSALEKSVASSVCVGSINSTETSWPAEP